MFVLVLVSSCTQYANVYVTAVSATSDGMRGQNVPLHAYSASSGLYFDVTPFTLRLKRTVPGPDTMLSIVLRSDCRLVGWGVFQVQAWSYSPSGATDASAKNVVRMEVRADDLTCSD